MRMIDKCLSGSLRNEWKTFALSYATHYTLYVFKLYSLFSPSLLLLIFCKGVPLFWVLGDNYSFTLKYDFVPW